MAKPNASYGADNHYKFICPVLGIERSYAEGLDMLENHKKGFHVGPPLLHALMSAGKDPVEHMRNLEWQRGEALFFDADPNCTAKPVPKEVVNRVKSVLITERQMEHLAESDKQLCAEINDAAVPADARDPGRPKAVNAGGRVSLKGHRQTAAPIPVLGANNEAVMPHGYADAITKAVAREASASKHRDPAGTEREWKVNTEKPAAAAQEAPRPKLSLLELARKMKTAA